MFHVTCYGWLIFRARSAGQIRDLTRSLVANFAPATMNVHGMLVPLLLYTTPLLAVHACEAWFDDGLVVPQLPVGVRYSIYAATWPTSRCSLAISAGRNSSIFSSRPDRHARWTRTGRRPTHDEHDDTMDTKNVSRRLFIVLVIVKLRP